MVTRQSGFEGPGKRLADATPGPWTEWAETDRAQRAIRFIETYCRTPKGRGYGEPLKLAEFQKRWIRAALADDVDIAILQTPRGNGKSSLGGALALWALYDDVLTGAPQVPVIATTVLQAVRSVYGVAAAMVKAEPELWRRTMIYTGMGTTRLSVPFNGGEMFPVSNDPDGLQGLDPSFAIVDEIGFQPLEAWDSLRLASGKRERSLITGLGTPGLDRNNALFAVRRLVKEGADLPGVVFHEYSAPEGCRIDDRDLWRRANPAIEAGFLRESALETDLGLAGAGGIPEGHFRIFRLGQWYQGVDSWLGPNGYAIWEGLTNPYELRDGAPTYVGVDIGLTDDTTAIVALQRREDSGKWHAVAKVWVPTRDRPNDVTDAMHYLRELNDRYKLVAVAYDARYFDVPAKTLSDEGMVMAQVPQSVEHMTPAYMSLRSAILKGELTHDDDETFATHILNGVARYSDRGFLLAKDKSRGKIDAAVALCLGYDQALRFEDTASRYEERGLVEI